MPPIPQITSLSRRRLLQGSLACLALPGCTAVKMNSQPIKPATQFVAIDAPFDMPAIEIPDFTDVANFNIRDFGAAENNQSTTQTALRNAIAAANQAGAGKVIIPSGTWPCGPIHLLSNVNLHLEEGATLLFSANPTDYLPPVQTTWEGMECFNYSPLVYAYNCHNIAITGKGTLQAKLDVWQAWYARPKAHMDALANLYHMASQDVPVEHRLMTYAGANLRPHFVQFNRCQHILVEGIHIQDSPFWVLHPFMCKDVVFRHVSVSAHGHNNDGVDPEMTQNMLIEHCTFDQGDDAIAVKAGRNRDAWRLNMPCRNIVMRHCRIKRAHQLLAIGSELSGGVENIWVHDCHFDGSEVFQSDALPYSGTGNIVFIKTNERRGGFVRNVIVENVKADSIGGGILAIDTDVLYQWRHLVPTYERRLTPIEHIHISNVSVNNAAFISQIKGQAELPVDEVYLRNLTVESISGEAYSHDHVKRIEMK
ncbi:glycoside hydrolase family 28 protein [Alteromonas sp. AMM-1]|uniref:glycoside hydrolase family 28 protein n=1 Tax=Alteromonas sp. AMM-1 TaxID=3394233 RepID=UPI0039A46100